MSDDDLRCPECDEEVDEPLETWVLREDGDEDLIRECPTCGEGLERLGPGRDPGAPAVGPEGDDLRCESCGVAVAREDYVAVGPSTPAARQLDLKVPDPDRGHFVVCDPCFEDAADAI